MKMSPVVHFEMPADDKQRMAKFYSTVFGWKTESMGPETEEYIVVTTTPNGDNGRPTTPGAINGGFFQRGSDPRTQHPMLVISVDDIEVAMAEVKAAGGTVAGEVQDIPGIGRYVSIIDTENNRINLLQPSSDMTK